MTGSEARGLVVRELGAAEDGAWDAFVADCPEATFFHRAGWRQIAEDVLGHRCHYLWARAGDVIRGVLPLCHVTSRLFGNALISNGFCVYGGPACTDAAAGEALDRAALALAESLGVDYLEYRLLAPRHRDWARNDRLYATFRKALDPDPDRNLAAVPRKRRAMIRKGMQNGLVSELDDDVDRFYAVEAESMRNLGTPIQSKAYYAALKRVFGDDCDVLTVCHRGRPVSAVMSFYFRDEVLPYHGGGTRAARPLAGNDFLYWEVMRRACERGCRVYDFGRSKRGTGSFDFKTIWGFAPQPLSYEYRLVRGREVPFVNPLNPRYARAIAVWKRLPVSIANRLGPPIARCIG